MLFLLFELLGVLVAGNVVDCIFTLLDEKYVPWITAVTDAWFSSAAVREILSGEFGVLTMSVKIVVAVLLPLIAAFYLFVALLEDSGYLPRLAVLTDNVLSKIGLNGRAVIPLLLGFGCGAMGTISTRILGTARERTIVTAILGITVPCGTDGKGLPIGMQLIGDCFQEKKILRAAYAFEKTGAFERPGLARTAGRKPEEMQTAYGAGGVQTEERSVRDEQTV